MTHELRTFFELLDAVPRPGDAEFLFDRATADGSLRRRNLDHYFDLMRAAGSRVLLVAEAPGWRGTTISGVPFMSARELAARPGLITTSAQGDGFELPEHAAAPWEASSRDVWAALRRWRGALPVFWPIYPHHPFVAGDPKTNRAPRPAEVRAGAPLALEVARVFDVARIVAVGRKAQGALAAGGIEAEAVRHPAQGGARLFAGQLAALNARG